MRFFCRSIVFITNSGFRCSVQTSPAIKTDGAIGLSLIIPTLNEEETLPLLLDALAPILARVEVIIVDGGSIDATLKRARTCCASAGSWVLVETPPGRGLQIATGVASSTQEGLLILHADSLPSPAMVEELRSFVTLDPDRQRFYAPTLFRLRFDHDTPLLRLYARAARIESVLTSFGDQGLLIGRDMYERIGSIRPIPLFEDVDFFRRARRSATLRKSSAEIITSARRFAANGVIRTQWRNMWLLFSFLRGGDPVRLQRNYRGRRYTGNSHIGGWTDVEPQDHPNLAERKTFENLSTKQNGEEEQ